MTPFLFCSLLGDLGLMKYSDWVHDKYEGDRDGMLYGSDMLYGWFLTNF